MAGGGRLFVWRTIRPYNYAMTPTEAAFHYRAMLIRGYGLAAVQAQARADGWELERYE